MNAAHLHLLLVHIPVVIVPLGAIILAFSLWRKSAPIKSMALFLFQGAAIAAAAAFLFGEGAEEAVEHLTGVLESAIEAHEESATVALWLTATLGIASFAFVLSQKLRPQVTRFFIVPILLLSVLSSGVLAYTAQQGGRIRHPEAFATAAAEHGSDVARHIERDDD